MSSNNPWLNATEAGDIIQKAREDLALTQDQVAEELGVDKSYISKLEGGKHHAGRSKYFPQLVRVLKLKHEQAAQLNPGAVVGDQLSPHSGPPVPPRLPLRPLPQGLQDAVDAFGKRFPDLLNPVWQQYLAGFQWRRGVPDDPNAWLDLYRDLDRAGVVPGEE